MEKQAEMTKHQFHLLRAEEENRILILSWSSEKKLHSILQTLPIPSFPVTVSYQPTLPV